MMFIILLALIPFVGWAIEEPHHTTAFINQAHTLDTLITYSTYKTDHFWNEEGKRLPTFNSFKQESYLLYSEYTFNDANTFFINGGYSTVHESLNGKSQALHDLDLGWKYSLCQSERNAWALETIFIVPLGDRKASIRYGQFGLQASLLYSEQFASGRRLYKADMGIGYRLYQGFPSSQARAFLSIGTEAWKRISLIATGELIYGVSDKNKPHIRNNITLNPSFQLLKGKIECLFAITNKIAISIGGYRHFWGKNIGTGGGGFCGCWIDL